MLVYGHKLVVLPLVRDDGPSSATVEAGDAGPADATSSETARAPEDEQRHSVFRSYVIDGAEISPRVRNVTDFVLLEGFYQPTIVLLHEPMPTWAGRHAVTRDTRALVQLSLNLAEQRHTVMWTMTQLPSDATQLFPIPRPLGGVLVFGANCLLRLNQATPPFGVSVNSHAHHWPASFPLREQPDCDAIVLDRSVKVLLDPSHILLALADGKIYVLSLLSEGRTFLGFDFQRLASSVLPHCACKVGAEHVFLGSRMGDSQLLWCVDKPVWSFFPLNQFWCLCTGSNSL